MKTKPSVKEFDAVQLMRDARNKISHDITDMSFEEIKKYFQERKQKFEAGNPRKG